MAPTKKVQRYKCQECGHYFTNIEFYEESIQKIRDSLSFEYSAMDELFEIELDLPKVQRVYSDEAFIYDTIYAEKSIQGKGAMTNKIENLNSQLRDKISYLVRKTKAHAKSAEWLDYRLAIFFNAKNLRLWLIRQRLKFNTSLSS